MDPEELRAKIKTGAVVASFFLVALLFYALRWRGPLIAYLFLLVVISTLAVLIQSGRGSGLAASIAGVGGDSLLGVHSATPIAKATYVMLALFIFIPMLIARMPDPAGEGGGLLDQQQAAPLEGQMDLPQAPPPGGAAEQVPAPPPLEQEPTG